jgi:hypothetical protein
VLTGLPTTNTSVDRRKELITLAGFLGQIISCGTKPQAIGCRRMNTPRPAQSVEDIQAEIKACQEKIANMRPSLERQKIMAHIARLRLRANAKRWLAKMPKSLGR